MKESRHTRDGSLAAVQIRTDFSREFLEPLSHSKVASSERPAPARGILKKSPTASRREEEGRECKAESTSDLPAIWGNLTSQRISPTSSKYSTSPEVTQRIPSRLQCVPKPRYSRQSWDDSASEGSPLQIEEPTLKLEMGRVAETIKKELQDAERARSEARSLLLRDILREVEGMKSPQQDRDQSLVVLESSCESGSETERIALRDNRSALKIALETYSTSPQQLADLRSLLDNCGTPRLALLLRRNRVEGMYQESASCWSKVYGGKDAPAVVAPAMVKAGFEVCGRELRPLCEKQLWKADAFTL